MSNSGAGHGMIISVQDAGKINKVVADWFSTKHQQGMRNVNTAERAKQQALKLGIKDGGGITWWTKTMVYIAPWWNSTATFSDANDGAVLISGKNLDGSDATIGDYTAASLGVLIPFVSGSAITKFFKVAKSGSGRDVLQGILKKVDNITTALDEKHVTAAINDILGNPIVINGKSYDHLTEVKNALKGLGNQIENLNKAINSGDLTDEVLEVAKKARSELQTTKDSITEVLNKAEKC